MKKITLGIFVMFLPLILLFQNCGTERSGGVTQSQTAPGEDVPVAVEGDDTISAGTVSDIDFGYDAAADSFRYSLNMQSGEVKNAQGEIVLNFGDGESDTAAYSNIVNVITNNKLVQGQAAATCAADEIGVPVFAKLILSGGRNFTLNLAKADCGLINFENSSGGATLDQLLSDIEMEIETP